MTLVIEILDEISHADPHYIVDYLYWMTVSAQI